MNDTAVIFLIVIACCAIIIAAVCILGTALFFFRSLPLSRAHINQGRNVQEYRLEEAVITREEAEEPQTAQEISEPAVQVAAPVKTDEAQSAWTGELSERDPTKFAWAAGYPAYLKKSKLAKNIEILASGEGLVELVFSFVVDLPNRLMAILDPDPAVVAETNKRITEIRKEDPKLDNPIGEPFQNLWAFTMVRQSAAPRFFARKQLHKIIISLPEKESMTKGLPRGLNMAQTYAEIIKPGGLLFALSKHELPMESFAAAFDAASDQWHRLDDAQWRKDPFGDLLIHAGSEHYAVNANIAVWKRKSSGYESFVERGRTLRRS